MEPGILVKKQYQLKVYLNVAVTDLLAVMVTTQVPVPLQAPLQLTKLLPGIGVAVSVTTVG